MKNIYVGQFRDVLKFYYNKQKDLNAKIEENNKRYTQEYSFTENSKVWEEQKQAYLSAKKLIKQIFAEVRGLLANASFIDADYITSDRVLFSKDSIFDLSVEEVQAYVEKYQNNPVMLRMIKEWISKYDLGTQEHPAGKYASINIILPSDKVTAYKSLADDAIKICDRIYNNGLIMKNPIEIDTYADEIMKQNVLSVIGGGMELNDFKNRQIPETATHIYDNITVTDNSGDSE